MGNNLATCAAQHRRNRFPEEDAVSSLLDAMTFSRVRKTSETIWGVCSLLQVKTRVICEEHLGIFRLIRFFTALVVLGISTASATSVL